MGALAPISPPWIPEDDLKLKNAVEAGASLESLAKGAVQFSRRFTVQELRERWHSLLYDPFVSAEAAALMFEFERSVLSLPSKASRCGNAKEIITPGKRKAESVRSCYYAMRKRTCKEPFNSMDLSFLVSQEDNNCLGNGDEPSSANCMMGDAISNHFGFQQPNLDTMHHSFPQNVMDGTAANSVGHAYHTGLHNVGENNFLAEQNSIQEDIPHVLGENQCLVANCSRVEEVGQSTELPVCSMYESSNLEGKCSSSFDHINNDSGNLCSGFGGTQVFNSPISDCGATFHNLGYSSPLPEMPIWRTIEGISAPDMQIDISIAEKDHCRRDEFSLPNDGDAMNTSTSGFDVGHSGSKLNNQISCDDFKCSSAEGFFEELSNSLFDFTNDEELTFMDGDGKDKSYYDGFSSLLLNSPSDINRDHIPNITEPELPPDSYLAIPDGAYPGESHDNGDPHHGEGHNVVVSEIQMLSSTPYIISQNPEMRDGVICCTLNTEDQEIPLNDDVILAKQMHSSPSTATQKNSHEAKNRSFSFVKDLLESNKKRIESVPSFIAKERKDLGQCHVSSKVTGTRGLPEMGPHHPISGCGSQIEFPKDGTLNGVSRGASVSFGVPNQINSAIVSTKAILPKKLKEECIETELEKHLSFNLVDSFHEEPANGSDSFKSHPWTNANCSIQEIDVPVTNQNHQVPHAELGSIDVTMEELVANPSPSDQDELPFDDDSCVPCSSDIEAMILGMPLGPDDQDVHFSEEVSKYHHDATRRKIIRLEQSIHARMQREIAVHGAFAVLYGHHLKHFIKKREVLLGRATGDIIVDIDLGREGCANKISRRQAIMKMDDLGNFYVKNLGKCSIFVNDKEVASGQSRTLNSDCVIEIRELWFIFETNQTCVKQYMDNITSRSHTQEHKF